MEARDFYGIYQDLAEHMGIEVAIKIHEYLQGMQITFPVKLYSKEYIERQIKERYDGSNSRCLAKELGYTERYFKQMLLNTDKDTKYT